MIDMHVHSTASDGTLDPSEIAAAGADFAVLALTDHDTVSGQKEFMSAAEQGEGIRLSGVELSVRPGRGYGRFHLLGLGFDPSDAHVAALLAKVLSGRNERNRRILENFARIGIDMPRRELDRHANGEILARPHFAAWLVEHGYAKDVRDAFDRYLKPDSPAATRCYEERIRPAPREAFAAIHAAGGVAVMAHPKYWTKDPARLRKGLARLKEQGLDGIEAVYQANLPEETVDHLMAAKELDLAVTAGSDFHGRNKPEIRMGMEIGDEKTFLAPFFAALDARRAAARDACTMVTR